MTFTSPNINRWHAFALLAVSYFMTIVDLTIVTVSLPTIGRDLHVTETSLQWVLTAYAVSFGAVLLLGGRAADLLGRRRILMAGLALFTAASLACGLATGDGFLIGSRAVQRVGAAIMVPAALSIVMTMFEEGGDRNKALGIWGGLAAAGATVGLIAGGLLTRYAGWQYVFFLNVPIGAAALALAPRLVPASRLATTRRRFDALGAIVGTGGLVLLVDAIADAPQHGWGATRRWRSSRDLWRCWSPSRRSRAGRRSLCCRSRSFGSARSPARISQGCCPAAASLRSSSLARCTCSRYCGIAPLRPGSRGSPRR
jgi:MFS family permease